MSTTTGHDANGFPFTLPEPVSFHMEESDEWFCKACDEDVHGDVDDAGHEYDGDTAVQIWTAVPLKGEGDGDVFSGTFEDALAHFTRTFMGSED